MIRRHRGVVRGTPRRRLPVRDDAGSGRRLPAHPVTPGREWRAAVLEAAEDHGWTLVRATLEPRHIFVHPGQKRVLFVLVADQRQRVTRAERRRLRDLTASGNEAYVWRPADWRHVELALRGPSAS